VVTGSVVPGAAIPGAAPLAGYSVIDMTRFVSGSYAAMLLAMLGADVIKVELAPGGDPYRQQGTAFVGGRSALFGALNRGKRSVVIDLKSSVGRADLDRLLSGADVFMENGRPGSLCGHGLDADTLSRRFPDLVYASISGYGQVGPDATRGGFDLILQAEGGLMSVTGEPDSGPVKVGVPALDIGSAVSCALGVVAALLGRERRGGGAVVSSSLLEFALATFTSVAPAYFVDGEVPGRLGSHSPTFAPYGAYRAQDGYLVLAGAGSELLWQRLCEAIGAPGLIDDVRFVTNADRVAHLPELITELEERLGARDCASWLETFGKVNVPAAQVRSLDQVLASEQVRALGIIQCDPDDPAAVPAIGAPLQINGPLAGTRRAPSLGEHTAEVLGAVAPLAGDAR